MNGSLVLMLTGLALLSAVAAFLLVVFAAFALVVDAMYGMRVVVRASARAIRHRVAEPAPRPRRRLPTARQWRRTAGVWP